jgi:hypothetical protein
MKHLTRDLHLSGHISPNPKMCAAVVETRWRLLAGRDLDSIKVPPTTVRPWTSLWTSLWMRMSITVQLNAMSLSVHFTFPSLSHQDLTWFFFIWMDGCTCRIVPVFFQMKLL